jgi:hypothetical protein
MDRSSSARIYRWTMYRSPEYCDAMNDDADVDADHWNSIARSILLLILGVAGVLLVIAILATPSASAAGGCGGG